MKAGKLASLYISIPSTCWPWPTSPGYLVSGDMVCARKVWGLFFFLFFFSFGSVVLNLFFFTFVF